MNARIDARLALSRRGALRIGGCVGIGALAPQLLVACVAGGAAASEPDRRIDFTYPDPADFSTLNWSAAFIAAHDKFSREYAFGEWKSVDWNGLYSHYQQRIARAQATADQNAYYLALHEYLCSIPDGHLSLRAESLTVPMALCRAQAGGGFGMALAELDDLRVIAAAVISGGPADLAGIRTGAEIIRWGARSASTAIAAISVGAIVYKALTGTLGSEGPQATHEHYRIEQLRLLGRGPIGVDVQVEFRNPGATNPRTVTLTAMDDGGQTFSLLNFAARPEFINRVDYHILPEGFGYVRVPMEFDPAQLEAYPSSVFEAFQKAVSTFVSAAVPGIIIDLRGNYGGSDQLAADMCGFFYSTPAFYEEQEFFDKRDGSFLRLTLAERGTEPIVDHLSIEPQWPHYAGSIVVLVNPATSSSGEGPPLHLSRLSNAKVIGFHGTNGSFGMTGGKIRLPGGYAMTFPFGRSVDQHGVVQLDSRNGIGGVAPDPRVPKTLENVLAFAAGIDVELQYAVRYLMRA